MEFTQEQNLFINEFVKKLRNGNAAIFSGAGLSVAAGFVNWKQLLKDIAIELELDIDKELDLISLAQYHVNTKRSKSQLNKKILEEFIEDVEPTENHRILSRLPINTFWTTNYDTLLEDTLKNFNKIVDVKHEVKQLSNTRHKRDAVVYKMHGDVDHSSDAIITKDQYEKYYITHGPFITALSGDLITKTFLFIGFSFTDPNLDYILSRIRVNFGEDNNNHHYCFLRKIKFGEKGCESKADFEYQTRKQVLMIDDLKRFSVNAILVEEYQDITTILSKIETRYKRNSIFISGSAEEYGEWGRLRAMKLIHKLSAKLIAKNYRVVNGFGWGIGSAVINGALEQIYSNPKKYSEDQLVMKPFPQFATGEKDLPELWQDYRTKMISLTGISIYCFGNKFDKKGKYIINADGVKAEFEIALKQGCMPIPLGSTGYISNVLWKIVMDKFEDIYGKNKEIEEEIKVLEKEQNAEKVIQSVVRIIDKVNQN
ncbi:SIR2 family protein [Psychroserpens luteus]|uniref:NAD(+) hydrolase ThsA n=1 Tax=Psychroserpens luteus TaxID=1434066 RepID=A0ABW5ZNJ2_9FLAO|nr:SIR2 family protein [Psychroserpens luteus]